MLEWVALAEISFCMVERFRQKTPNWKDQVGCGIRWSQRVRPDESKDCTRSS